MSENETTQPGAFEMMILVLSVYVIIALFIEVAFTLPPEVQSVLQTADTGICFIFLADFFMRLSRSQQKIEFLKWNWIDFVSSIPMLEAFRIGRLTRIIRLFRILRAARSVKVVISFAFRNRKQGVTASVATISIILLVWGAISMLVVETGPESNIETAGDALWWAFVTITTVGYGDFFPVTLEGRLVAAILMAAGVGLFGTFTGLVTALFVEQEEEEDVHLSVIKDIYGDLIILREKIEFMEEELKSLREKEKY